MWPGGWCSAGQRGSVLSFSKAALSASVDGQLVGRCSFAWRAEFRRRAVLRRAIASADLAFVCRRRSRTLASPRNDSPGRERLAQAQWRPFGPSVVGLARLRMVASRGSARAKRTVPVLGKSRCLTESALMAAERKPGPSAGEFRFDAIASGISASTPVGALFLSARSRADSDVSEMRPRATSRSGRSRGSEWSSSGEGGGALAWPMARGAAL